MDSFVSRHEVEKRFLVVRPGQYVDPKRTLVVLKLS